MSKRFAFIWLWGILSAFFTIVILPTHSLHTWWHDLITFCCVAITIYAIYIAITETK